MKITPCTTCKETGQTTEDGCQVVCPDCLGVGAVNVQPAEPRYGAGSNAALILARFARSLTGMAGGTVIREHEPVNQPSGFGGLLSSDLFGHGGRPDKKT